MRATAPAAWAIAEALVLAAGPVCIRPAFASPTFYTDQSAFDAAAGAPTSFGFSSIVSGSGTAGYATASGLTLDGMTFVGTTGNGGYYLGAEGPDYIAVDYDHGLDLPSLQAPALTSNFYGITDGATTITFAGSGVTAFGLDLFDVLAGDYSGAGTDTVNLAAGGGTGSVVTPPATGDAFIGFVSSTPITSVTLTGTAGEEFPTIVGVSFVAAVGGGGGGTTSVSEPASLLMLAVGFVALTSAQRRGTG
jgi:hypothetical protein